MLLCLADLCPVVAVRHAATRLLDSLPTDQKVLAVLKAAFASPHPAEAIAPLLLPSVPGAPAIPAVKPARLLYTLQVGPNIPTIVQH